VLARISLGGESSTLAWICALHSVGLEAGLDVGLQLHSITSSRAAVMGDGGPAPAAQASGGGRGAAFLRLHSDLR
jgi:hypothetical protein